MAIPAQGDRIEPAGNGPSRRAKLFTTATAVAIAAATAATTGFLLPRHAFVASAIIGVEGGPGAMRPALAQAAADAAVSRRVLTRAAANGTVPADELSRTVRAEVGHVPGSLMVRAQDNDAERAAAMATSVATALVSDLEDRAQDAGRAADAAAAMRLAKLQDAAVAAHRRLAELGEDGSDGAATGAGAAARVTALRARLDAIHAIIASGNPPLGTGRDVPTYIDALQTSYLDLTRQLAKATETLGDRHTTVIGLRDGIKRTAADLSAAWARLAKTTEADLNEAKTRAAAAAKGGVRDASRVGLVAAARAGAQAADEAVARAQASAHDDDQAHYRLIARAPVPALADGLAPPVHLAAAGLAGLVMLLLSLRILRPKTSEGSEREAEPVEVSDEPSAPPLRMSQREPAMHMFFEDATREPAPAPRIEPTSAPAAAAHDEAAASASCEDLLQTALQARAAEALRKLERASAAAPAPAPRREPSDLSDAMAAVLPAIAAIAPRDEVPVILVATNETGVSTMDTVLALGEAAAAAGRRVLLVEGDKARPALAAAVDERAEPALIEVFGDWRVVLRAECGGGLLYLAPSFRDGARLAEDLADAGDTLIADSLADEFDLVVIDGDRAGEACELARDADAFLRVGRFASLRDDERFLAKLGAPRHALLGTVAADVFRPAASHRPAPVADEPTTPVAAALRAAAGGRPHRAPFVASRKPVGSDLRPRVGLR